MMIDEKNRQSCQRWKKQKGENKKKRKRKEKCSLKFYVDGAWNQKKLSIDV
jgi:hypothetical protein